MSTEPRPAPTPGAPDAPGPAPQPRARRVKLRTPLSAYGEPMVWLTGGSLVVCVLMIVCLLLLVLWMGLVSFWPAPLERITVLTPGTNAEGEPVAVEETFLGEVTRSDTYAPDPTQFAALPEGIRSRLRPALKDNDGRIQRRLFRTGNFDLTNRHFRWFNDPAIVDGGASFPEWALTIERVEWGRFYGFPARFKVDDEIVAEDPAGVWNQYAEHHGEVRDRWERRKDLEQDALGTVRLAQERARLRVRDVEIERGLMPIWAQAYRDVHRLESEIAEGQAGLADRLETARSRLERLETSAGRPPEQAVAAYERTLDRYRGVLRETERRSGEIFEEIRQINAENDRYVMVMRTADDMEKAIPLDQIVRAYPANRLSLGDKLGVYFSRWWEFLSDDPRAANSEGGVFPAIVGTVLMTLIMAILVVPFGVTAALYLREYASGGPIVSAVRIAINNLAGVPSIVFGVFGLGFFCYGVGDFIDGGPQWEMPKPIWFVLLAGLVAVSFGAFLSMVAGAVRPRERPTLFKRLMRYLSRLLWLGSAAAALLLIATTPFFDGFFRASLPNPTFGKGALVWASFTLALLTLPVVIVATEEALSAVPNSMREGSYACGASKWQTIKRIVLPRAMPGIMTGAILAMARGAGEVAPLMLVGAVKLAPKLPISLDPGENFGINRSFMHLGFHIYDLGFQSQNSEAAKPLVFTTTLLLIVIVAALNLAAIGLRSRLKRKFIGTQF
ncbi:MAG: ABC transporter permease subunit [Planctomycetota bacterium]|nr:ABC transporter permease subunit [Planctomycetota bacterium]